MCLVDDRSGVCMYIWVKSMGVGVYVCECPGEVGKRNIFPAVIIVLWPFIFIFIFIHYSLLSI